MSSFVIEPHYLASLEYYALLIQYDSVLFEVNERFQKQTFKNRCYVLTSGSRVQPLILPLRYSNKTWTKDVIVDHSQRWRKDHWGALYSAYGKAPFFEYFSEAFRKVWNKKQKYLIDINHDFFELMLDFLQLNVRLTYTSKYECVYENDFRNIILPKKPFIDRKIYSPVPYVQLFGNIFVPNLSIIDLIMCKGPSSGQMLKLSFSGEYSQ